MAKKGQRRKPQLHKSRNGQIGYRMQTKLIFIFGIICFLFICLIFRIMYIESTSGKKYEKIVLSQQEYASTTIPYQRGNIIDAKGTVLASSIDVYNVVLDCKALNKEPDLIEPTLSALEQCFAEVDTDKARKALKEKKDSQYTVLAKKVSYEEKKKFDQLKEKLQEDDVKNNEVYGIWTEKEYIRQYPYNSLAASLIGFSTSGNEGINGLEKKYNSVLNGVNGRSYGYVNDDSDVERTVIEPQNGENIVTSIDANIQQIVEGCITEWADSIRGENPLAAEHIGVIVMNPNDGTIYAMASYPFFDLNNPRDLSAYYTEEQLKGMSDEDQLNVLNNIWQNYTVSATYEPGSTFKPFTVAAGLETGAFSTGSTFNCSGVTQIGPDTIHCWKHSGHGIETVENALRDSCDSALIQMAQLEGGDTFAKYQALFGFGQKTGIDLPGEASTAGLMYGAEDLKKTPVNLAVNSFGQSFNTTMIQLATAFSSIVNGGDLYQPHVVTAYQDSSGNVVKTIDPVVEKQTVSKETSEEIKKALRTVVRNGTGKKAGVDGYSVSGKTGTAEKLPRGNGNYLLSFISATPAENPQLVTYVVVDQPHVDGQADSTAAKDLTKNILTQVLPYMNVPTIAEMQANGITTYDSMAVGESDSDSVNSNH